MVLFLLIGAGSWAAKRFFFVDRESQNAPSGMTAAGDPVADPDAPMFHRARTFASTNPSPVAIDLLKGLDIDLADVVGTWEIKDGALTSDTGAATRFDSGYRPPDEYDVRLEFSRVAGNDGLDVILVGNGRQFMWTIAGWDNTVCGIAEVFGKAADENSTTVRGQWLTNGRRYVCLVKVRRGSVQAFLDDKLVSDYVTDFDDLGVISRRLHHTDTIGLSSWQSAYAIYSATVTEISGTGKRYGPDERAVPATIAVWAYSVADRSPVDHAMFANGHMKTPDGSELWFLQGNQILFQWGGFFDAATLAPDRKSFEGTTRSGEPVHGDLVSGGL